MEAVTAHRYEYLPCLISFREELTKSDSEYTSQAEEKKAGIDSVWNELQGLGVSDNRHSNLSVADISTIRESLTEELKKRTEAYDAELSRQKLFEDKRKEFAGKAQAFIDLLATAHATLEKVEGTPSVRNFNKFSSNFQQEKINKINEIHNNGSEAKSHFDQISALASEMRSLGIQGNAHTKYTLPVLSSKLNLHNTYVNSLISSLK